MTETIDRRAWVAGVSAILALVGLPSCTPPGGDLFTGGGSAAIPDSCGNGARDSGEECDGADLGGATCARYGYSTAGGLTCTRACKLDASACRATCDGAALEKGESCDGALLGTLTCSDFGYADPAGLVCKACTPDASGCKARCQNARREPGEACDGADLDGKTCVDFGFSSAAGLRCSAACALDAAGCAPRCDGVKVEPGEDCDGANLGAHSCTELGYVNAAGLACSSNCKLDSSGCKPACGNRTTEPGEQCDDGNRDGGDGCSAACQFEGSSCASAVRVALGLGMRTLQGTTTGGGNHRSSACSSAAPDRVFAVTPSSNGFLTAWLKRAGTSFDSVLHAGTVCTEGASFASMTCADSFDPNGIDALNGGELVSFRVVQGSTYYLFVDGAVAGDAGTFELSVDLSTGLDCSDPVPLRLEAGSEMLLLGSTVGTVNSAGGTCGGATPAGEDVVYEVTRGGSSAISAETTTSETTYNAVLYARATCGSSSSQLDCDNPGQNGGGAYVSFDAGSTPVYLWVDGSPVNGSSVSGSYGLLLTP